MLPTSPAGQSGSRFRPERIGTGAYPSSASASRAQLQEFARKQKLSYPLAIDGPDPQKASFGRTFAAYSVHGIPAYAVIDRAGQVAYLGGSLAEAVGSLGGLLEQ